MALSDYEKQVLEQMEAEFRRADPELASEMAKSVDPDAPSGSLSPRRIALGAVIAVAGLAVLVGAVSLGYSLWSILLGVLGFVLMVLGVWLAVSTKKAEGGAPKNRAGAGGTGAWARFIEDQERRWQNRRRDD